MKNKLLIFVFIMFLLAGCKIKNNNDKLNIVVTSFPCYDLARAVFKDQANINLLIAPGTEVHTYDPTPQDIIEINDADLFIYIGGESDEWVNNILNSSDNKKINALKLINYIHPLKEDGEDEYDEHIWTSPKNMILMLEAIKSEAIKLDKSNKDKYLNNADNYINKIKEIDLKYQNIVSNANKNTIIFADRFPFKYLVNDYNIKYNAAYNGCAAESEISAKKLKELINTVKDNNISIIFYLELSNQNIADAIIKETNVKKELFQSGQNVTKKDFDKGITLVDILNENAIKLERALN